MHLHGKFISIFSSLRCFTLGAAAIFIFFITNTSYSQVIDIKTGDTLRVNDSANITRVKKSSDTLRNTISTDSVRKPTFSDSNAVKRMEKELGIKISKDALPSVVKADAEDSAEMNLDKNISHMYGKVQVNYEDMQVNHGQIIYDQSNNKVIAGPSADPKVDTGVLKKGTFIQGKEKFSYDSMQYNFKSKRAIVRNVQTQYGEGYMHSDQIKRNPDQVIYGAHSVYTTCALDTPHFGIVASRIKVVPDKVIVSGPANINIMGVPTPLFIPFALFPISQKQKSGFVIPTYTIEQSRGLGLLNGGYYFYLNDHVDLLAQTNIYTKGSYAISTVSNYSNIYRYRGGLSLSYAYNKTGENFEPGASIKKDFIVNWRHASDAKARPGVTFNASVQAGTSSFYSNNSYDPNQILQNQYQSNISFAKNWQDKPFGLTISALHSQNTATKEINVTLPSVNFHVTQFNPFSNKKRIKARWYDKITASYNIDMVNRGTFYDSTFDPTKFTTSSFQSGIKHNVPVSANYNIFRYINMSFSANYNEYWLTEKLQRGYNVGSDKLDTVRTNGFYTARDYNAGLNFSTRIYGMKLFKKGGLRGIRHVMTPAVGISYHPDFAQSYYGYYYQARLDTTNNYYQQSYFAGSPLGQPAAGRAGLINFGVGNNLQIKVRNNNDTTGSGTKNVTLIDGLSINTSYNLAVDTFQWSPIGMSFRTNILDKINVTANSSFDPYATDYETGRRTPKTLYDLGQGIAKFKQASLSLGANFHSKPAGGQNNPTNSEEYARVMRNAGYNEYVDFNIPWSLNLSYSLSAINNFTSFGKRDSLQLSHNMIFQGEFQLTSRWKLSLNSGYNFTYKQLTLTSIDLYRDLHCWTMHLQTYPFGPRKSYNFTLNVKASVLQDLKLTRRRDFRDTPLY